MAWPTSLQVALKEWATVCRALESGRQIILLRKGGIYEAAGEFEVEHREFLLFPTYVHQNLKMLKPSEHEGFEPRSEENFLPFFFGPVDPSLPEGGPRPP